MRIDVLTLFPEMFGEVFTHGVIGRAIGNGLVDVRTSNFRDFAHDRHHTVDDTPYGGGAGMVLKPGPLFEAVENIISETAPADEAQGHEIRRKIILMTPQGRSFSQEMAGELAALDHIILICGRYEGFDERVRQHLVTDEVSIGDFVLSGGEIPAMVVTDAVIRLLPGVLGSLESAEDDSFSDGLLQFPQYTRPPDFKGWQVPDILLSGNHEEIARWRRRQSLARTMERRPDLLKAKARGDREGHPSEGPCGTVK